MSNELQTTLESVTKKTWLKPCEDTLLASFILDFYRAFTLDRENYINFHGSTVVTPNGKGIIFADGIACTGKTCCARIAAENGSKYVVDECSLYSTETESVIGNKELKLCIKDQDSVSFKTIEELGYAHQPDTKITAIVSPHKSDTNKIVKIEGEDKNIRLWIAENAHQVKMINPDLDRINFMSSARKIEDFYEGQKPKTDLDYYDVFLKDLDQLVPLMKEANLW
jgi:hypothetical protein